MWKNPSAVKAAHDLAEASLWTPMAALTAEPYMGPLTFEDIIQEDLDSLLGTRDRSLAEDAEVNSLVSRR